MSKSYTYPEFPYRQSAAQREGRVERHPLVVIGAGPIGLSVALDCAQRGIPVLLLDDNNTVSVGSRAVCYAKRPLEIWDRLGVAAPLVDKGVRWQVGKVFLEDEQVYQFDLLPEGGHKMPAMINLQQYYVEQTLVDACEAHPKVVVGWKHKLVALQQQDDHARLTVQTPDGSFDLLADWVIACDGANSDTRKMVGAQFTGQFFEDRFLIADVVLKPGVLAPAQGAQRLGSEPERWFWFDPPFHRGQSVLLHKQCDDVWRIDFQLGRDADQEAEKRPERVIPRIQAMLGPELPFELEWVSVYQFACRRIDKLRYGRVIFAGDAAHQVSPFGARGANTGVQDADNLAWKLKLVLDGVAPEALIDSYHEERAFAADDNLLNSTRATDFISPKSAVSLRLRNAVLELAADRALRAAADQQRPAVDAHAVPALVAEHAGRRGLRRADEAWYQLRRRAAAPSGPAGLAAERAEHAARPGAAASRCWPSVIDRPSKAWPKAASSRACCRWAAMSTMPKACWPSATTPSPARST